MSEMVERVARAIYAHDFMLPVGWEGSQIIARAAIAAMREPLPEMAEAGRQHINCGNGDAEPVWEAMIDEALREKGPAV